MYLGQICVLKKENVLCYKHPPFSLSNSSQMETKVITMEMMKPWTNSAHSKNLPRPDGVSFILHICGWDLRSEGYWGNKFPQMEQWNKLLHSGACPSAIWQCSKNSVVYMLVSKKNVDLTFNVKVVCYYEKQLSSMSSPTFRWEKLSFKGNVTVTISRKCWSTYLI